MREVVRVQAPCGSCGSCGSAPNPLIGQGIYFRRRLRKSLRKFSGSSRGVLGADLSRRGEGVE